MMNEPVLIAFRVHNTRARAHYDSFVGEKASLKLKELHSTSLREIKATRHYTRGKRTALRSPFLQVTSDEFHFNSKQNHARAPTRGKI